MKADWEDPFDQLKTKVPAGLHTVSDFKKNSAIFSPIHNIDLKSIRETQRNLYPYLEVLYDAAVEQLAAADAGATLTSKRELFSKIMYRLPDQPHILNDFRLQQTAHGVTLFPDTGEKSHPLIERMFPVKHWDELTQEAQQALYDTVRMKLLRPRMAYADVPPFIRIVIPEIMKQIMHWIKEIDSPIFSYGFFLRRPSDDSMRHAVTAYRLN